MMPRSLRLLLLAGAGLCALRPEARAQFSALAGAGNGARSQPLSRDQPVTFNADRIEYDRDSGLVTATGHVEAWQNDHVLRADRVTYDRTTNIAAASGNVALVEPDGQVLFSDYAELTDSMREGVLRGMRAILAENGKLVANGARRTEGKLNELSHAIYSTCDLCKDDPSKAPLWQLRAWSALQDTEHKRIEYQDVWVDLYGVPVAYFPYFSHPDPSVKRQSGFLVPTIVPHDKHLGTGIAVPYYWVLDDQSDVVVTPTAGTGNGPNLDALYRRRFNDGSVSVNGAVGYDWYRRDTSDEGTTKGIQAAVFAKGQFAWDEQWRYGFDINRATSRDYLRDFRFHDIGDVLTSQVYLEGFGVGAYTRLDARAYQGLTDSVVQSRLPYVLPRWEYSFLGAPDALGGRLSLDANAFNVYRSQGTRTQRAALTLNWERPFTGRLGELYSVALHVDAAAYNARDLDRQPNFASSSSASTARALPQVALNARWPFLRAGSGGDTEVIEPIAQLILAPNPGNRKNSTIPNEDSLDFEFSDANLFSFNRFPGLDRLEGGVRANYALHGSWSRGGATIDGLVGQSYRFHKDAIFAPQSGLEGRASDIVSRVTFSPTGWLDLTGRARLDHGNFRVRMADAIGSAGVPLFRVTAGYTYESVNPYYLYDQATIPAGYYTPRNEITLGASSQFGPWKLSGFARRDIKNNEMVAAGASGSYEDECFIFSANFYRRYTSIDNDHGSTTILFQITLKTVGQFGFHAF